MAELYEVQTARVNVTWDGQNGDYPNDIPYDTSPADVLALVAESIESGSIPGLSSEGPVDLRDFVVERFPPTAEVPTHRIFVRPKTPFGA